jgi:N-acetylmuramoyl-L-alanine amidase
MLELGHLDPVDELSGVQARCNLLGHDCGVVDGIMGSNTRQGIKAFQTHNSLEVDGIAGPLTQQALQKAYGC